MQRIALSIAAACLFLGCFGDDPFVVQPPASVAFDVTGTWSGTWTSDSGAGGGTLTMELLTDMAKSSENTRGLVTRGSSPCIDEGTIAATASVEGEGGALSGIWHAGVIEIEFAAVVDQDSMTGTYGTVDDQYCSSENGTFTVTRLTASSLGAGSDPVMSRGMWFVLEDGEITASGFSETRDDQDGTTTYATPQRSRTLWLLSWRRSDQLRRVGAEGFVALEESGDARPTVGFRTGARLSEHSTD